MTRMDLDRIRRAQAVIDPVFLNSPQYECPPLGGARRGIPVTVVAAQTANPLKIERIRALGATVRLEGDDIEDARLLARRIAADEGAYLVEDSLDVATCEGAGTIGLDSSQACMTSTHS